MLVYTTNRAISEMAEVLRRDGGLSDDQLAEEYKRILRENIASPDMALMGRMLETGALEDTAVEGALQVAHAISTHKAIPEIDYYVAADDVPGPDAGAGYLNEATFTSACYYKYFAIHWELLCQNLRGFGPKHEQLAAHTVGAFLQAAALVTPTGKQHSFAAHNVPDAILVEIRNDPISYANAFAKPVEHGERDLVSQSIAQLAQYVDDLNVGYGGPRDRLWFSPNLRHRLQVIRHNQETPVVNSDCEFASLEKLVEAVIGKLRFNWQEVQKVTVTEAVVNDT